jgi:hypothetical protein
MGKERPGTGSRVGFLFPPSTGENRFGMRDRDAGGGRGTPGGRRGRSEIIRVFLSGLGSCQGVGGTGHKRLQGPNLRGEGDAPSSWWLFFCCKVVFSQEVGLGSIHKTLTKLWVINYYNQIRGFSRLSITNKTIDWLNIYFGRSCHHQESVCRLFIPANWHNFQ